MRARARTGVFLLALAALPLCASIPRTTLSGGTASTVFLHNNHRGDVVLATDDSGAAVGRYDYTAFGMPLPATGTYSPRFGFSSKERDASGLVYYGFRFHAPDLCRWINADPIREDGGLNLYRFCGNDPMNFVDVFGLDTYRQNRQLNPTGSSTRQPVEHGISHTFLYTTRPDGTLDMTYSWGNEYDNKERGLWCVNRPEDISAASEAIRQRKEYSTAPYWKKLFLKDNFGPKVGDRSMDKVIRNLFIDKVLNSNDPSLHPWRLDNNCKNEADNMINEARGSGATNK